MRVTGSICIVKGLGLCLCRKVSAITIPQRKPRAAYSNPNDHRAKHQEQNNGW
jgi:hypothetical protein